MDTIRLPGVTVELHKGWTRSVFDDGTECTAVAQHDAESIARARALGYEGTPAEVVDQMSRDHDLVHHLLALLVLGRPCPVLHDVARGGAGRIRGARDVEAAVLGVQSHVNRLVRPAYLRLSAPAPNRPER